MPLSTLGLPTNTPGRLTDIKIQLKGKNPNSDNISLDGKVRSCMNSFTNMPKGHTSFIVKSLSAFRVENIETQNIEPAVDVLFKFTKQTAEDGDHISYTID